MFCLCTIDSVGSKRSERSRKSGDPEESKVNDLDSDEDLSVGIHTLPKTGQIGAPILLQCNTYYLVLGVLVILLTVVFTKEKRRTN